MSDNKHNYERYIDLCNADKVAPTLAEIEKQEPYGQQAFIRSSVLPTEITGVSKEDLEQNGFKFGRQVDELFQQATLPLGWTKRPAEHSMWWSEIIDNAGNVRALVFYKATIHDRSAFPVWNR